jgi:hypothetical protein
VNIELNGGERPTSVVTLGMNRVLCAGTQPTGSVGAGGSLHGSTPVLPCVLTGNFAAETAAGFVDV